LQGEFAVVSTPLQNASGRFLRIDVMREGGGHVAVAEIEVDGSTEDANTVKQSGGATTLSAGDLIREEQRRIWNGLRTGAIASHRQCLE
jgi:hypothetical protein